MVMKLGMEHYVLKLYKVSIIDDPEPTLTYFTTVSNLAKKFFVRPRYQVCVYRTIGLLVFKLDENSRCDCSVVFIDL